MQYAGPDGAITVYWDSDGALSHARGQNTFELRISTIAGSGFDLANLIENGVGHLV